MSNIKLLTSPFDHGWVASHYSVRLFRGFIAQILLRVPLIAIVICHMCESDWLGGKRSTKQQKERNPDRRPCIMPVKKSLFRKWLSFQLSLCSLGAVSRWSSLTNSDTSHDIGAMASWDVCNRDQRETISCISVSYLLEVVVCKKGYKNRSSHKNMTFNPHNDLFSHHVSWIKRMDKITKQGKR